MHIERIASTPRLSGAVLHGDLIYLSGQGPRDAEGKPISGKVPTEVSIDEAYQLARRVGLSLLSVAASAAGGPAITASQSSAPESRTTTTTQTRFFDGSNDFVLRHTRGQDLAQGLVAAACDVIL